MRLRGLPLAALRAYRTLLSPMLPAACRFRPSCSEYAVEAIEKHGTFRGGTLAVRRVIRCGPWNPGGYDPVPPRSTPGESLDGAHPRKAL